MLKVQIYFGDNLAVMAARELTQKVQRVSHVGTTHPKEVLDT